MHFNSPSLPHFRFKILLYFAHADEAKKANLHGYKRIIKGCHFGLRCINMELHESYAITQSCVNYHFCRVCLTTSMASEKVNGPTHRTFLVLFYYYCYYYYYYYISFFYSLLLMILFLHSRWTESLFLLHL